MTLKKYDDELYDLWCDVVGLYEKHVFMLNQIEGVYLDVLMNDTRVWKAWNDWQNALPGKVDALRDRINRMARERDIDIRVGNYPRVKH